MKSSLKYYFKWGAFLRVRNKIISESEEFAANKRITRRGLAQDEFPHSD